MTDEERGWLPAGTTQGDLNDGDFAWLSSAYKAGNQSKTDGRKLPFKIHGKVNEAGWRAAWTRVHQMSAADFEGGPSQSAVIAKLLANKPSGVNVAPQRASKNNYEIRVAAETWPTADLELRTSAEGMNFRGYAAVFNSDSEKIPYIGIERIKPGAFTKSLAENRNIRMFLNHDTSVLLASTKAGTLRLGEDDKGLWVDADLPETTAGRDLSTLMKRGDVDSMSFGFKANRVTQREDITGRDVVEAKLFEVSPITGFPAYTATTAYVRHLAETTEEEPEALAEAFRLLQQDEEPLSDEHYNLLLRVLNTRRGDRQIAAPLLSSWREKFASLQ